MVDFFSGHTHCTRFSGLTSEFLPITVIHGSAIGPAADLTLAKAGNLLAKYADDTYLIVPATNVDSHALEFDNIETWAKANNLALNRSKTIETVFTDGKRKRPATQPPSLPDIS